MDKFEWHLLRGTLLVLLMAVCFAVTVIYGASSYLERQQLAYKQQRDKLDDVAQLYRTAVSDRQLYSKYVAEFERLDNSGVIGDEPRLIWIEALEAVNRSLRLPRLDYEIAPQQQMNLDASVLGATGMRLFRSEMHVQMNSFHELDFLDALRQLRQRTEGRFEVRSCRLRKLADVVITQPLKANLEASCYLNWYTVNTPTEGARP